MTALDAASAPGPPIAGAAEPDRWAVLTSLVRRVAARASVVVLVVALALLVGLPLYELQRLAIEDGAQGYDVVVNSPNFWPSLWNTVWLAVGSTSMALVLGIALAWFGMRLPRGFGWLSIVPVLPIVLPAVASITGWIFIFSPRVGYGNQVLRLLPWWSDLGTGPADVFTLPWIVIVTGLALTAFVYLFVSSGLRNVNSELIDAAQASGSSAPGAFFRVTLPVLRPPIVYATAVCMMLALGQFTAPLLLGRQVGVGVLTTEMYLYLVQAPLINVGAAAAVAFPLIIIGIAFVVGQRTLLGNQARFVSHGNKSFRPVGRRSPLAAVLLGGYGLVAAVLPLIGIVLVAFSPYWSGDINVGQFTLEHVRSALENPRITGAVRNSLTFSFWAMLITLPLGYVVASLLVKGRRFPLLQALLDFIVMIPLGVPAVIFGFGFLLAYSGEPLNLTGTPAVVVLVYVTLMLPFSTRLQLSGMMGLGNAHTDASATCGAGTIYTNLKITIPMMRTAIAGAAALVFVLLSHEFAASILVRDINTNVMGTILYDTFQNGVISQVAVIALIMGVVTAVGLGVALAIGGRRTLDSM